VLASSCVSPTSSWSRIVATAAWYVRDVMRDACDVTHTTQIGVRRLTGVARTPTLLGRLREFVDETDGTPYETRYTQLLKAAQRTNKDADLDAVFCSELVAAAFQRVGVLAPLPLAANVTPKDLSGDLALVFATPGVALADIIECKRNETRYTTTARDKRLLTSPLMSPVMSPRSLSPRLSSPPRLPSSALISTTSPSTTAAGTPATATTTTSALTSSSSSSSVLLEGELLVKHGNKWTSRYVVLSHETLTVYASASDRHATRALPLSLAFASVKETTPARAKRVRYTFEVWSGVQHVVFGTSAVSLIKRWVMEIQIECERLMQRCVCVCSVQCLIACVRATGICSVWVRWSTSV
jgi:hypothetical protein